MSLPKQLLATVAVVTALFAPSLAQAGYYRGLQLKEWADADDRSRQTNPQCTDFQESSTLHGYVIGVYDTVAGLSVCVPAGVSGVQLMEVVKRYVNANPSKWNQPAAPLVVDALNGAFPCKK
jgi:hypothetical protein